MSIFKQNISVWLGFFTVWGIAVSIALSMPSAGIPAYTPDSIYYILAANAIDHGHGISLFNYSLFHPGYVPYTTWPPFYPLLLATHVPPLFIQAGLLGCLAGISFLLLNKVAGTSFFPAMILSLVIALPWPILMDASYVWSELFALFWLFVSMMALAAIEYDNVNFNKRTAIFWLLTLTAVSCAIYTRYAALTFIPGIMLVLFRLPIRILWRWVLVIATPFVVGLLVAPLLLRNLIDNGSVSGAARAASSLPLKNLFSTVGLYLGWNFAIDNWERAVFVFSLLALFAAMLVYRIDSRRLPYKSEKSRTNAHWLAWISTSFAISYLVGIVILRIWKHFDFSVRMLSPVAPLILLSLTSWGVIIWQTTPSRWQRLVLVAPFGMVICLSALVSGQMGLHARHNWRATNSPQWHMNALLLYTDLQPIVEPKIKGILLASRPALMAFQTGWKFRRIPKPAWTSQTLKQIMSKAGGEFINNGTSERLAMALKPIVSHPRFFKMGRGMLMIWGQTKASLKK